MRIHEWLASEAISALKSTATGLSDSEAERRLKEFGPNEITEQIQEKLSIRLLREFTNFFAVILWIAAALALISEHQSPGQGMGILALAIIGVILVNGLFSFWQEFRAEKSIQALRKLLPHTIKIFRGGSLIQSPSTAIVPGDILLLREGDSVPADCRLIEANGFRVNNATLTGESAGRALHVEPDSATTLQHAMNIVWAGTAVVSGEAKAVVFATGMHTEFGKIAQITQSAERGDSPLRRDIARLSRIISIFAVGLGVLFFFVGLFLHIPFWQTLLFTIGIIVANVPEGLLPTLTLSLAIAAQRMAKRNVLVRHLPSIEVLGSTTVICTDKTGTLTLNKMTVTELFLREGFCDPLHPNPGIAAAPAYRSFLEGAFLCHHLDEVQRNGKSELTGDPMEIALVSMARQAATRISFAFSSGERIGEIPFDTTRKRVSVIYQNGSQIRLYCKGAPESVFPLCSGLTDEDRLHFQQAQEEMTQRGLRVIAFAHHEKHQFPVNETEMILDGLAGIEDPPRPEVPEALRKCRAAGIRVMMITGDHPLTAAAIARQVAMGATVQPEVFTGDQVDRMSEAQLQLVLGAPEILFARTGPEQKMRIVNALKRKGDIVAVTGDGVNDAPALRSAHVGIAMGQSGTDVAKEAADVVLLDDNFATIVAGIEEGRGVFDNIRKFLTYILTSNVPELIPYLAYFLFDLPLALTVIQILVIDLGTDMIPALALGTEEPGPEVMARGPRSRKEPIVTKALLGHAYLFLGVFETAAGLGAFFYLLNTSGWHFGTALAPTDPRYYAATTAYLSAVIVMQVANVFLCRTTGDSIFKKNPFHNRLLWIGILIELAILIWIVYTPSGNAIFTTGSLPLVFWLKLLPFAVLMLLAEELRKRISKFLRNPLHS